MKNRIIKKFTTCYYVKISEFQPGCAGVTRGNGVQILWDHFFNSAKTEEKLVGGGIVR